MWKRDRRHFETSGNDTCGRMGFTTDGFRTDVFTKDNLQRIDLGRMVLTTDGFRTDRFTTDNLQRIDLGRMVFTTDGLRTDGFTTDYLQRIDLGRMDLQRMDLGQMGLRRMGSQRIHCVKLTGPQALRDVRQRHLQEKLRAGPAFEQQQGRGFHGVFHGRFPAG